MGDKLGEMFQEWNKTAPVDATSLQIFQGGVTASAVSMRQRALDLVQKANTGKMAGKLNDLMNAIGELSDIPTE